jgi:hypothetical protein
MGYILELVQHASAFDGADEKCLQIGMFIGSVAHMVDKAGGLTRAFDGAEINERALDMLRYIDDTVRNSPPIAIDYGGTIMQRTIDEQLAERKNVDRPMTDIATFIRFSGEAILEIRDILKGREVKP